MPSASFKRSQRLQLSLDLEAAEPVRQQMRNCQSPLAADGAAQAPFSVLLESQSPVGGSVARFPSNLTLCGISGVDMGVNGNGMSYHGGGSILAHSPPGSSPLVSMMNFAPTDQTRSFHAPIYSPSPLLLQQPHQQQQHVVPTSPPPAHHPGGMVIRLEAFDDGGVDVDTPCIQGQSVSSACSPLGLQFTSSGIIELVPEEEEAPKLLIGNVADELPEEGSPHLAAGGTEWLSFQQSLSLPDFVCPPVDTLTQVGGESVTRLHAVGERTGGGGNPLMSSASVSPQLPMMLPPSNIPGFLDAGLQTEDFSNSSRASGNRSAMGVGERQRRESQLIPQTLIHRCESLPILASTGVYSNVSANNNNHSASFSSNWPLAGSPDIDVIDRRVPSPADTSQIVSLPMPIDANPADVINLGTPLFATMGALSNNAGFDLLNTNSYRLVHDAYLGSGNGGTVRRVKRVPVTYGYYVATPIAAGGGGGGVDVPLGATSTFHHNSGGFESSSADVFSGGGSLLPSPSCSGMPFVVPAVPSPHATTTTGSSSHTPATGTPPSDGYNARSSPGSVTRITTTNNNNNTSSNNSVPFKSPPSPGNRSSVQSSDMEQVSVHRVPSFVPSDTSCKSSPTATALSGLLSASRKRRERIASAAGPVLRRETMQCPLVVDSSSTSQQSPANGTSSRAASRGVLMFPPSRGSSVSGGSDGGVINPHSSPPVSQGRRKDKKRSGLVDIITTNGSFSVPKRHSIDNTRGGQPGSSSNTTGTSSSTNPSAPPVGWGNTSASAHLLASGDAHRRATLAAFSRVDSEGGFLSTSNHLNTPNGPARAGAGSSPLGNLHHRFINPSCSLSLLSPASPPTTTLADCPTYFALKEINLNSQERVDEIQRELKNLVASHRYYYYPTDLSPDAEASPRSRHRRYRRRRERESSHISTARGEAAPTTSSNTTASNNRSTSARTVSSPMSSSLTQQHHKRGGVLGGGVAGSWASFGSLPGMAHTPSLPPSATAAAKGGGYVPYPVSCNHVVDYFGAFQHENTIVIVMELLENSVDSLLKSHVKAMKQSDIGSSPLLARVHGSCSFTNEPPLLDTKGRPPLAPSPAAAPLPSSPPCMGGLPLRWIAVIARDVLRGLLFLHKVRTLVHRDLKPGNLLFTTDPTVGIRRHAHQMPLSPASASQSNNASTTMAPSALIKIADFGVSHEFSGASDEAFGKSQNSGTAEVGEEASESAPPPQTTTAFIGSVSYMSPERLRNDPYGYPSDIWSMGVLLLEMALGKHPFNDALTKNGQRLASSLRQEERFWCILGHLSKEETWTRRDVVDTCSSSSSVEGGPSFGAEVEEELPNSPVRGPSHYRIPTECAATCPIFTDFIQQALAKLDTERATAGELLRHPFILMHCSHDPLVLSEISNLFADELREFTERTGMSIPESAHLPPSFSATSTPHHGTLTTNHTTNGTPMSCAGTPSNRYPTTSNSPFHQRGGGTPFCQMAASIDDSGILMMPSEGSESRATTHRSSIFGTRSLSLTGAEGAPNMPPLPPQQDVKRRSVVVMASSARIPSQVVHVSCADELPAFTKGSHSTGGSTAQTPERTSTLGGDEGAVAALSGFRRRSSVLFSPSTFSFTSTPGYASQGAGTTGDFALDSEGHRPHRHSLSGGRAESDKSSQPFWAKAASSAAEGDGPLTFLSVKDGGSSSRADTGMEDPLDCSTSRPDAPFHLAPPLPKDGHQSAYLESHQHLDASLTTLMAIIPPQSKPLHVNLGKGAAEEEFVVAAFKETMEPVDTDRILGNVISPAAAPPAGRMMLAALGPSDLYAAVPDEDTRSERSAVATALRTRNVMVSLLTGNPSVEQSERAELALFMRSTIR